MRKRRVDVVDGVERGELLWKEQVAERNAFFLVARDVSEVVPTNPVRQCQPLRDLPFVLNEEAPGVEQVLVTAGTLHAGQRIDPRPVLRERSIGDEVDEVVEAQRDPSVGVVEPRVVVAPPAAHAEFQRVAALEDCNDVPPVEVVLDEHRWPPSRADAQALALHADVRDVHWNGPAIGRLVESSPPVDVAPAEAEFVENRRRERVRPAALESVHVAIVGGAEPPAIDLRLDVVLHLVEVEVESIRRIVQVLVDAAVVLVPVAERAAHESSLVDHGQAARDEARRLGFAAGLAHAEYVGGGSRRARDDCVFWRPLPEDLRAKGVRELLLSPADELSGLERAH